MEFLTEILQRWLVILAKDLEVGVSVEYVVNLRPCDYLGVRHITVERLVKSVHVRVGDTAHTVNFIRRSHGHMPRELERRGG